MPPSIKRMVVDMLASKRLAELCEASRGGLACKADLLDTLDRCKRASLEEILASLKRNALTELCRVLGLDVTGTKKASFVARILDRLQSSPEQLELPGIRAIGLRSAMVTPSDDRAAAPSRPSSTGAIATSMSDRSAPEEWLSHYIRGAVDVLRGGPGGDHEFHVLVLLFYKRLCDAQEALDTRAEGVGPTANDGRRTVRLRVPGGATLADIMRRPTAPGEALDAALLAIEAHNPTLQGVFEEVKFANKHRFSDAVLRRLLTHLAACGLGPSEVEVDKLGEAFEVLIQAQYERNSMGFYGRSFAPRAVARLLVALVEPRRWTSVYDPACGAGELLLQAARSLAHAGANTRHVALIGDERSRTCWAMAKMLFALNELDHTGLAHRSRLESPQPINQSSSSPTLPRYDVVVANVPPSTRSREFGELAILQHMLASLERDGRMAAIVPYGVLFRGIEEKFREGVLRSDLLEAVIRLGPNLFAGLSIPVAVLLLRSKKPRARKGRVVMIDGSDVFVRQGRRNALASEHVARLVEAVRSFRNEAGFCRVVSVAEICANRFELSVEHYMHSNLAPPCEDIGAETVRLDKFVAARDAVVAKAALHVIGSKPTHAVLRDVDEEIRAELAVLHQLRHLRRLRVFQMLTRGSGGPGLPSEVVLEIPRGWELRELGQMLSENPRSGVSRPKDATGTEVLYIGQAALSADGFVHFEHQRRISLGDPELSRSALMPGDVLMVRVHGKPEGCGRAALVTNVVEPVVCVPSIFRLRPNPAEIDPRILLHWLHHPPVRHLLTSRLCGGGRQFIRQSAVMSLPCPVVPLHERAAFARELYDMDEAVEAAVRRLAQVRARKDVLARAPSNAPSRSQDRSLEGR